MLKFISILFLLLTLLGLSSCTYFEMGPYFHPSYSGGENYVARRDCCGGAGPDEVLVIVGPGGVQLTLVLWNGETGLQGLINGIAGKGVFGEMGIYVPTGSVVDFQSNIIIFKNLQAKNEYSFNLEKVQISDNRYRNICPNWLEYVRYYRDYNNNKTALTPFVGKFKGKGEYGTHIWIDLDTSEKFGNPEKIRIVLPTMRINGVDFQPDPIDFLWSPSKRYLYPLNC